MGVPLGTLREVGHRTLIAAVFGLSLSIPLIGQAAGLKDALSTIDTGPFKDAACQTAIDGLIGAVDGLGGVAISNLKVEDDAISGTVKLPVGGTWALHLFGADCSKSVYAFLKPGTDLKLSNMVFSAGALKELDKLGLKDQAFILSNTEDTLKAGDAPDAVSKALAAAADGDKAAEVDVKPGLTVLGIMDLSRSTYTKQALSFLGLKSSASQKIAVDALLAKDMLSALLKGNKGKADFTLKGTMPSVTLTLPGNHQLPTAALQFQADVHPDAKEFDMTAEVEDTWKNALGISGLSLSKVAIDLKAGDETSAELDAETKIGGQTLDVSWSVDKADESVETELKLTAPEGKTFKIGAIHGLSKVPGINSLGFKELDVSTAGFGGRLIWNKKELDAAIVSLGKAKKPVVLMKTETFAFSDISKAIGKTPLGGIKIPGMILTLAETDPGSISTRDIPDVASAILGDLEEKSGSHLTLHQGVGVIGAIDSHDLGAAGKALGASGELILGGTLGGLFGGSPEIDLYAAFPTFNPKKMPKFLRAAKDVTPQINLAFKEKGGIEADIGVNLVTHLKVDKQELELETAVTAVVATSGVGLNISASLDKWEHAFTLTGFDIDNVAISIEVDADSSVSAGFQGHVVLKNGRTEFEVQALLSPDLAAVGLPKEVVLEISTNHVSLEGLMDLADVFIGATGNNPVAKAAKGKGLYHTLQFDKLPLIEYVQYKTDKGELEDVKIYLATPGATDPALDIDGWGVGVEGRLRVAKKDIAQAKVDLGEHGFDMKGEVLLDKLGPLKIKKGEIDAAAGLKDLPHLHLEADAVLLGIEEAITIEFSKEEMAFSETAKFGQAFTSVISAKATIADVHNPDFDVALEFQGDLLDTVLGGIEKELNKFVGVYEADLKKAHKAFEDAEKSVDKEEKRVDDAFKKAEADIKKATDKIDAAIKKVNGIQSNINKTKDKVHDKSHQLHKLHWYEVGKAIKLGLEIAGLEIEIGGLYAAKATATAALEVAKAATNLTPALFQPVVMAANAAFEAAKGALKATDAAVQATDYIFKGLEKLIEAYRKNFHFSEAKFDGSLQALLGNKPIVMDVKFTVFGENVNIDLSFTPTKPENIAKAIGGMVSKLAKEAVEGIKHAFFGGGSSHSSKHAHAVASWAEKNHATKDSTFGGTSWANAGPKGRSVPLKGNLYKNARLNRCLVYGSGKLKFSSCDSTKDDHLFRFTPGGELTAVASGTKTPFCLEATGVAPGAPLEAAKCSGAPQQKWRYDAGEFQLASGECAAIDKHKNLVLADCNTKDKAQQWTATPIADLKKLSETPASSFYTVSLRDEKTGKCADAADKILLSYDCDDSDYQTYNLNTKGQLRILNNCVRAEKTKAGSNVFLGKCDGKETKWTWTGEHLKVKGTKGVGLCLARGKTLPKPISVQILQLGACSLKDAVWELEPANVDAEGRILPAYHMIRSKGYGRCIEIRTKLQIDGLPIPQTVMWDCNGDFNQSFSFRWNGEIRSLGKCLSASGGRGAQVALADCYRRPSAFQITPALLKSGGQNRHSINHQRWKVRKDGLIQKIGTPFCLAANSKGLHMKSLGAFKGAKFFPAVPVPGPVGGAGSLLTLQICKKSDKTQVWTIDNKLPGGKKPEPYKRLAHKVGGKERCLETSGDSSFRKLVARTCSASNSYQQFLLAANGEIRQMGRCVTTNRAAKSFSDGFQIELEECKEDGSQKWLRPVSGLIYQKTSGNGLSCITEGPSFGPSILFGGKALPAALKSKLGKLPSFALIGAETCHLQIKNVKSRKCMAVRADGSLSEASCLSSSALAKGQVFEIAGGTLTHVAVSKGKLNQVHPFMNLAAGSKLPTIKAIPPGTDPKAIAHLLSLYAKSGFLYQPGKDPAKGGQFKYKNEGKWTSDCLAIAKSGTAPSASTLKKLEADFTQKTVIWSQLFAISHIQKNKKAAADKARKDMLAAQKKLDDARAAGALSVARCSKTNTTQSWTFTPVPETKWGTK